MTQTSHLLRLLFNLLKARFAIIGLSPPPQPINVTFSVTRRCQSRCKTCYIWKLDPEKDLDLEIIEKLFRELRWTYFFNISGGEPFLRDDLIDIVKLACRYLHPAVIHTPTNALMPERIEAETRRCLEVIRSEAPGTIFTVKPSFDGIGELHDEIRGVPGNFQKLEETISRLKNLALEFPELHVGVGTVVSRFNIDRLEEIITYSEKWNVDSYINEIAEEREEFFNIGSGITPDDDTYEKVMSVFKKSVRSKMKSQKLLARITTALRIVYYDLAVKTVRENRQVIPCYAGLLNVHINSDGAVWPCAVLAYRSEMGRISPEAGFSSIWKSEKSRKIRKSIRKKQCVCPLANQAYSNILMHPPSLLKAIWIALTS